LRNLKYSALDNQILLKNLLIRKNVSKIDNDERNALLEAFILLNKDKRFYYPGNRADKPFPGGVSYWFKQD